MIWQAGSGNGWRRLAVVMVGLVSAIGGLAGCGDDEGGQEANQLTGTIVVGNLDGEPIEGDVPIPDGARLVVQLVDASLADGPASPVAEQVAETGAFPFDYTIDLPAPLDPNRSYIVQAKVLGPDDELLYINDESFPIEPEQTTQDFHVIEVT